MARVSFEFEGAPRQVALEGNLVIVGADASCTVRVASADASSVHCELRRGPEGWRVVDLESRAGTKVNGEFVNTKQLRTGDVIDVGGVALRFEDDATAAPAAPRPVASAPAAPRAAPSRAATRAAPARAARGTAKGAAAADDADGRPARREPKKTDSATVAMYVAGGVLGLALAGWLLYKSVTSETHNHRVRIEMLDAERRMDWKLVLDLAHDAERDESFDWQEIQAISARARAAMAGEVTGRQVDESIRDWTAIRYWRQTHRGDDADYVAQIDDYLRKYQGMESEGVKQARDERVKVAGTSAVPGAPVTGDSAWNTALADAHALEGEGRFGDAIAKIDAYWKANESAAPTMVTAVQAEKARLTSAADKWFSRQIALAVHYLDNGERKKAGRHLAECADKIGLPGYDERARQETERILSGAK
jgi:hypothetical protein